MADADGEGGGSADWLPIYDRVEAMLSKSQAEAEALATDRARLEAADMVQRESREAARRLQRTVEELQAAAREKDGEIERLRAESSDARKELQEAHQADVSRKMRWEAAYVDLLLGASQKLAGEEPSFLGLARFLAELRDGDLEDSRTCAEPPKPKEVGSCSRLSQNVVDYIGSDLSTELRKLKRAYETLSSKKDKEVSALLSEKDSLSNQLSIMQKDYANKKMEAAQATEAALKLQQTVDELKVLVQKKDDEIGKFQAEAVGAKMNLQKTLVKKKGDKTLRLEEIHEFDDFFLMPIKASNATHKKSRSDDPVVYGKSKKNVGKDGKDETSQKRRCVSSVSNSSQGVPRPHEQLPSASPSASASAAASLIKLKEAEQEPKREKRLPARCGRGRGRRRGRRLLRTPAVPRQSCDQAEIGGQIEVEEKEKQQPEEEKLHQDGVARPCEQLPSASAAAGLIKLNEVEQQP